MSDDGGLGRTGRRDGDGGRFVDDSQLILIVKLGVVAFFGLLLLSVLYPPLTRTIRQSAGAMLVLVLGMFVCITVAVGALVLLNRRN